MVHIKQRFTNASYQFEDRQYFLLRQCTSPEYPVSDWMAPQYLPLAVPAQLARIIPLIFATSANCLAQVRAFCPVVPSSTTSVPDMHPDTPSPDPVNLMSSSIRFFLLSEECPAVSQKYVRISCFGCHCIIDNRCRICSRRPPMISTPARFLPTQ